MTTSAHPVDAAIKTFARVMSSPPAERDARLAEFAKAWRALRRHDPKEGVDTLAHRLGRLGVPVGQALVDVSRVVGEVEGSPAAKKKVAKKKVAKKRVAKKKVAKKKTKTAPAKKARAAVSKKKKTKKKAR